MLNTISFFRIIKNGITNFWRNRWLSAASTLIMVVTLIILSTLSLLFVITKFSVNSIRERVDISAYFKTGLAENQIIVVKEDLEKNPKVKSVTYISAEQALANFNSNPNRNQKVTDSIKELSENPLPATLQVKAVELGDYQSIADELNSEKYKASIDKVNYADNKLVIERLNRILKLIITLGLALIIIFSAIAVLVIFNTITLTIYNRREEVEIMRLVGATNSYIRGPFIVEALMYSIVATIVTSLLLIPVYTRIVPNLNIYLGASNDLFGAFYFQFWFIVIVQLVVACFLSILSSFMAIRRYLKV